MIAAVEDIFEKDIVRLKREVEIPTEKYRQIGERIHRDLLNDKRAAYGKKDGGIYVPNQFFHICTAKKIARQEIKCL